MRDGVEGALGAFDEYTAYVSTDRSFPGPATDSIGNLTGDEAVFTGLDPYQTYHFKVGAYREGSLVMASSPYTFRMSIRQATGRRPVFAWPLLALLDATAMPEALEAPRKATPIGWVAFELIGIFFLLGLCTWLCKAMPRLRATHVFFVDRGVVDPPEWLKKLDMTVEYKGRVGEIEAASGMAYNRLLQGKSIERGNLPQLVPVIRKTLTRQEFHGRIFSMLDFMRVWEMRAKSRLRNTPLDQKREAGKTKGKRKGLRTLPSMRILESALAAYSSRSEDIEASLEARISGEEEELRRLGFIDVLWAFGVTAPLVGLFGTVTGIAQSFNVIAVTAAQEANLMNRLAEGINEALYTTICGLIVGIVFMLVYYYYQYKLDRIHALWVMFAARFIDEIKNDLPSTTVHFGGEPDVE
jgi:biopolymer transport protein ExbB/TolQ